MKFNCNQVILSKNISIVNKAVIKSTNKDYSCIKIEIKDNKIYLISNNNEIHIQTIIDGEILEEGIVSVNADILDKIVKKLPLENICIYSEKQEENTILNITCNDIRYSIECHPIEETDRVKNIDDKHFLSVSQYILKNMIKGTIFSVSQISNDKVMKCENLKIQKNNELELASLDGYRISIRKEILIDGYRDINVVISSGILKIIESILEFDMNKFIYVSFDENNVYFKVENTIIIGSLIDEKFYDINKIVTDNYELKMIINKQILYNAINRSTSILSDDKKPIIFNIIDNKLELSLNCLNNKWKEVIDIEKEGINLKIGFNSEFLLEALKEIPDDEITIYMSNRISPCYIKDEKGKYYYLILPINIV